MNDLISGLLTQKPTSPAPTSGAVGRYEVEVKPKKSGDGTWNKIKNAGGDFGSPYKVLKVERKDDYVHDKHGTFHQYSILLEPATNGTGVVVRGNTVGDDARSDKIDRAVAFKGAVRIVAYQVQTGATTPEAAVTEIEKLTDSLLAVLSADPKAEPPVDTAGAGDLGKPDDDIPF